MLEVKDAGMCGATLSAGSCSEWHAVVICRSESLNSIVQSVHLSHRVGMSPGSKQS